LLVSLSILRYFPNQNLGLGIGHIFGLPQAGELVQKVKAFDSVVVEGLLKILSQQQLSSSANEGSVRHEQSSSTGKCWSFSMPQYDCR
jgi:hypothetical protein